MSKRNLPAKAVATNTALAERAVLGALLKNETLYWQVSDILRQDHFSLPLHQQIYGVIRDICEESKRLTLALLLSRLPEQDESGIGMDLTIHALIKNAEEIQTPLDFADQISEAANRRRLEAIGNALVRAAKSPEGAAIDIAGEAEMALLDVMHASAPKRPRLIGEIARGVMASAFKAKQDDFLPGLTTGLPSIDEILGLILPGDSGYILGAQADGKSALAMQIGMHVARQGIPVLVVQLEMSEEQVAARELAKESGITVRLINEGAFDFDQADRIKNAEESLRKHPLYVLDADDITVRQIKSHIVAMKRTLGVGLAIFDQLDKIKSPNRHRDKFERLTEITRDIKILSKSEKVPTITLAQRTRTAQRRDDPTPEIDDADTNSIERDADWVIAPWRLWNWLHKHKPKGRDEAEWMIWKDRLEKCADLADVICLKTRSGKAFEQRPLRWNGPRTRFEEL